MGRLEFSVISIGASLMEAQQKSLGPSPPKNEEDVIRLVAATPSFLRRANHGGALPSSRNTSATSDSAAKASADGCEMRMNRLSATGASVVLAQPCAEASQWCGSGSSMRLCGGVGRRARTRPSGRLKQALLLSEVLEKPKGHLAQLFCIEVRPLFGIHHERGWCRPSV